MLHLESTLTFDLNDADPLALISAFMSPVAIPFWNTWIAALCIISSYLVGTAGIEYMTCAVIKISKVYSSSACSKRRRAVGVELYCIRNVKLTIGSYRTACKDLKLTTCKRRRAIGFDV